MFSTGDEIVYNDGRAGHIDVLAIVLAVDSRGMTVQFSDRADTSRIQFVDRAWMDHIRMGSKHSVRK